MSIRITIDDPANTPRADLALVITILQRFYDSLGQDLVGRAPAIPIAPDDLPDTGVEAVTPEQAFGAAAGNAAAAFNLGNVPTPPPSPGAAIISSLAPAPGIASGPAVPPPAPSNTGATAPSGVQVDKNGLPWDARIHAKGANGPVLNADGTWRAKRGVSPLDVAKVEAELRQVMAIQRPQYAATVGAPEGTKVGMPPPASAPALLALIPPAPSGQPVPNAPPPTAATVPAIIPTAPAGVASTALLPNDARFPALIQKISPLFGTNTLTQEEASAACTQHGLPDLTQLVNRPDLVPLVEASIDAIVAAKG